MMRTRPEVIREFAPCTIASLPEESVDATVEAWKAYAVTVSERYGYAYTLFELAESGYLLVKSCEQDFFHFFPDFSGKFLRPEGRHLGFTTLVWWDHELFWTFRDWPAGPKVYPEVHPQDVGLAGQWYGQVPP